MLRDKFALGLFENPYVPENPAEIRKVAAEGVELSKRLAAASVTLLKNEKGLLPLFMRAFLTQLHRATAEGVPVKGGTGSCTWTSRRKSASRNSEVPT